RKYAEIARLMDSDAVVDIVEEAMNDPEISARFKADPKAHLAARGIRLPAVVASVEVTEKTNPGYCYQVCYWGFVLFIPYWCCRTECVWWW
ncbi:MAG TPA: hypothetical protein VHK90_06570, partial [Thermoanaerobaculia bacterium]|nr:hypothetical protein [Thermoanaerobaculia bacterium]